MFLYSKWNCTTRRCLHLRLYAGSEGVKGFEILTKIPLMQIERLFLFSFFALTLYTTERNICEWSIIKLTPACINDQSTTSNLSFGRSDIPVGKERRGWPARKFFYIILLYSINSFIIRGKFEFFPKIDNK